VAADVAGDVGLGAADGAAVSGEVSASGVEEATTAAGLELAAGPESELCCFAQPETRIAATAQNESK
jgi:hypothetical protein